MKSRTSFFNFSVLRKNLTRFAPLWVLYAIAEVLCLMTLDLQNPARVADNINDIMGPAGIFHMGYALLVAACLFGDLFDSRMCNGLHALPMRREGWLLTNLASGFLFALIPAIAGGAVAAVILKEFFWMAFLWQGVSLLQFVFFFGVAVLSTLCAGKRLGMIGVYALVNFLAMLVFWAATLIYQPLLPGVVLSDENFTLFSPVIQMANLTFVDYWYDWNLGGFFRGFIRESWICLYAYAGVGLLFLVVSWILYRKRHLETAGDFISFRPVKMVFLLAYTIAAGLLVYSFTDLVFGRAVDYGFLVVGILIGWFTGWMLLERTIKIFTKKVLLSFAVFALVFAGSLGLTVWDPAGVVTYVPAPEKVASASMYLLNDAYRYDGSNRFGGWHITDPKEINFVQDTHRAMIDSLDEPYDECIPVGVQYRLENGITVQRRYDVPVGSSAEEPLNTFFNDPRALLHTSENWETVKKNVQSVEIHWYDDKLPAVIHSWQHQQQLEDILTAFENDCQAGTLSQHRYLHGIYDPVVGMTITWDDQQYGKRSEHFSVYTGCTHLYEILKHM